MTAWTPAPEPGPRRGLLAWMGALLVVFGCTRDSAPPLRAAGSPTPVVGGTLRYASENDARSLDPAVGYDEVSWEVMHLVFDTLLRYDERGQLEGALAESFSRADDGRSYTFVLRPGLRFHNGRPVVADDVVQSWSRLFDPRLASPGADFFRLIEGSAARLAGDPAAPLGLRALDARTVEVRLSEPDPTFLAVVAMNFGAVVPIEEVEARGERWFMEPVGTGPFTLAAWEMGGELVLRRNPDYWEPGLPYLDEIVRQSNVPRDLQLLRMEAGELHQLYRLSAPDYLWVKSEPAWAAQLLEYPSTDTYAEFMNTELHPFDNVWFRRAVSTAIDREKLRKLSNGRSAPTLSWVPPALEGHVTWAGLSPEEQADFQYQRHDPALARRCLAEAGYPDGYPGPPIVYWTVNSGNALMTAMSVQADLAEIGVPIEIKNTGFPAYLSATGRRGAVAMGYGAWVMDYPHQRNFLEPRFHSRNISDENSTNESFFSDPEVDAWLDAAARALDPAEQAALYRLAHRRIARDAPYAFETHSLSLSLTQPALRGFRSSSFVQRDPRRAWLDLPPGEVHR